MIVPMIKYDFLLYHNDLTEFLERLQDIGVLDIQTKKGVQSSVVPIIAEAKRYETCCKWLKSIDVKSVNKPAEGTPSEILEQAETLRDYQNQLAAIIKKQEKEIDEALVWGDFQLDDLERLKQIELEPHFFAVPIKKFIEDWSREYYLVEINRDSKKVYFAILNQLGSELKFEYPEVKMPRASYKELLNELKQQEQEVHSTLLGLQQASLAVPVLEKEQARLLTEINLQLAANSVESGAEGTLLSLTGWVPETKNDQLIHFLAQQDVYYLSNNKPELSDEPPVLLANNAYSRLFEPITRLYSLPNYGELDPTTLFAPFYMIFFGFCLGDGGYGIIIVLLSLFFKYRSKDPSIQAYCSLGMWLGGATILFGCITGGFFGYVYEPLNFAGQIERAYPEYVKPTYSMLYLSLILGVIQILFGMLVNVYNIKIQRGLKYAAAQIAWVVVLVLGIIYFAFGTAIPQVIYYLIGGLSSFFIVFYNLPGKNPLINVGNSIWGTYNVLSGLLGDLLSYIRLFALGMTGGILGNVFNNLAKRASDAFDFPVIGVVIMIFILLFGHTLNLLLNGLGAIVHPLRLTFVEFYKNSGFAGGGRAYNPLEKKQI